MKSFIPYGRQFIDDEDIKAVVDVLRSDYLTQGPKILEFEKALASCCGAEYAAVFSSGTAALHAAYFTAGIGPGEEIITSPITFAATANAALYLDARPVFVDTEPDTANLNTALIESALTKKTKAIVPVHYAGHPADLDPILALAYREGIAVIEDACHALGAKYRDKKIGSVSDMTVFSFHPVKSITTGEGGAVLTDNKDYYEKLIMFRTHGITKDKAKFQVKAENNFKENLNHDFGDWYYEMQFLGYNYRITDMQAALGISQLKKLDSFIEKRRKIAAFYNSKFRDNPFFEIPPDKEYAYSACHLYPIRLKDTYAERKKEIFSGLRERGIGVQVHYIPVHLQPFYQALGYRQGLCPVAEDFYQREISLPVHVSLTEEDAKYVVDNILKSFN